MLHVRLKIRVRVSVSFYKYSVQSIIGTYIQNSKVASNFMYGEWHFSQSGDFKFCFKKIDNVCYITYVTFFFIEMKNIKLIIVVSFLSRFYVCFKSLKTVNIFSVRMIVDLRSCVTYVRILFYRRIFFYFLNIFTQIRNFHDFCYFQYYHEHIIYYTETTNKYNENKFRSF